MNKKILRENIFQLLEDETKFNEGDTVSSSKDGDGTVLLAKHPYYSVQLNSTGVTKSYHFTDLTESEPIESEFGKYDLEESVTADIIKLSGVLTVEEDIFLMDILSDIRSLPGVTVVRNEDIINDKQKAKLYLKIDPYPFGDQNDMKIESITIAKIKQIPGVKNFQKVKFVEKLKKDVVSTFSPIPVSSMDNLKERKVKYTLKEIKILSPGESYGINSKGE
jgi:hypothetical protein